MHAAWVCVCMCACVSVFQGSWTGRFNSTCQTAKKCSFLYLLLIHLIIFFIQFWKKICTYQLKVTLYIKILFLLSRSVISDSLWPYGLQHARLPCPSPTPRACSNSWPLSWWWHPTILSSVVPFSSYLHSFPASGPFLINQLFTSGGQSIELQHQSFQWIFREGRFPLGLTGLISLQSKSLLPYHGSKASVLQGSPAQVGCMRQVLRPGAPGRPRGIG